MTLPMLPQDKANHFVYGLAIAIVAAYAAMVVLGWSHQQGKWVGVVAAAAFGVAKEGFDYVMNKRSAAAGGPPVHTVDGMDALATAAGGLVAWVA